MTSIEEMLAGECFVDTPSTKENVVQDPEIIRFRVGDVILGRFLPYLKDAKKTQMEYTDSGITSLTSGEYVRCGKLRKSEGLKCPITDVRIRLWKKYEETKDETFRNYRNSCFTVAPKILLNWFSISHKNDKVDDFVERTLENRVVRLPANRNWQTKEITSHVYSEFHKAYFGENAEDDERLGTKIFNLGPDGVNFKFKIVDKGGFINYDQSAFERSSKAIKELGAQWQEPYSKVFDLEQYVPAIMSEDEINEILNTHLGEVMASLSSRKTFNGSARNSSTHEDGDSIPGIGSDSSVNKEDDADTEKVLENLRSKRQASSARK